MSSEQQMKQSEKHAVSVFLTIVVVNIIYGFGLVEMGWSSSECAKMEKGRWTNYSIISSAVASIVCSFDTHPF